MRQTRDPTLRDQNVPALPRSGAQRKLTDTMPFELRKTSQGSPGDEDEMLASGACRGTDAPKILQKWCETSLTRGAGRHQSVHVRSKYFKKNEKKACQASKT
jgi:hypothetical protein